MVYDWTGYEELVRRMVVEDGKTQDEVLAALKIRSFMPSKRALQNQLKKWEFSNKRASMSKDEEVIDTVKQLWEKHVLPNDMLRVLNEEKGVDIKKSELSKLRLSHGLYFRAPNAVKEDPVAVGVLEEEMTVAGPQSYASNIPQRYVPDIHQDLVDVSHSNLTDDLSLEQCRKRRCPAPYPGNGVGKSPSIPAYPLPSPDDLAARAAEKEQAQASRAVRISIRHHRRHAHASDLNDADSNAPPPPPRFPSEMTIEETRAILGLDQDTYQLVRETFKNICEDLDIVRKKGSPSWQSAKDTLISSIPALATAFDQFPSLLKAQSTIAPRVVSRDKKVLALDLLCMDITKAVRTKSARMTVAEAKKVLGLTPAEVTVARKALTARLLADGFVSKTASGEKHWKELRDAWIEEQRLKSGEQGTRAADVLCADVMKRVNDSKTRKKRTSSAEPEMTEAADGKDLERGTEGDRSPVVQGVQSPGVGASTASHPVDEFAFSSPTAQAIAYHTPPSQPPATTGYGYGPFPTAYAPYVPLLPGFQMMYPEIDPEILKMASGRSA
ncbi:hypothetical protein MMC13_008288 [Lambiella insularis]|nr:hypothetical protein [Lambiella insularis]